MQVTRAYIIYKPNDLNKKSLRLGNDMWQTSADSSLISANHLPQAHCVAKTNQCIETD